jgi:hypothetical protein
MENGLFLKQKSSAYRNLNRRSGISNIKQRFPGFVGALVFWGVDLDKE